MWKITFYCSNAKSMNFIFSKFSLPISGKLHIYNKDKSEIFNGIDYRNNTIIENKPGKFATSIINGNEITIEYNQSKDDTSKLILEIENVILGFKSLNFNDLKLETFGESKSCEQNVNCTSGIHSIQKSGIALIIDAGNRHCSGSLVNCANNINSFYFLTANHCLTPNSSTWVFIWDYESLGCSNPTSDPISSKPSTIGAVLKASNASTDFALLELTQKPYQLNPPFFANLNGWDKTSIAPASSFGIHHPKGDIKKLSIDNQAPILAGFSVPTGSDHWRVGFDIGTAEHGSSGSPLFNNYGRIIGQLHGIGVPNNGNFVDYCANRNIDYGCLHVSWTGGGTSTNSLKPWLDPLNTGISSVNGGMYFPCLSNINIVNPTLQNDFSSSTDNIISSSEIQNGLTVEYKAETSIRLLPGFSTTSSFLAKLQPCVPVIAPNVLKQFLNVEIIAKKQLEGLKLSPNPCSNELNLDFSENLKLKKISIVNASGQVLYMTIFNQPIEVLSYKINFDQINLATGLYFIEVIDELNNKFFAKFIKQ
jgi:hypothetical protein